MRSLVLLAIAFAASCSTATDAERPNVLLVVVDSLRADRLSTYGHTRPSRAVDALADAGTRFEAAYSSAPWTMPSVATLLTGLHPSTHGVTHTQASLPERAETLAERLGEAGYATSAVISHHLIGKKFRFDQGFERFDQESARGHRFISSGQVTQKAAAELGRLAKGDAPFFLFVHYFDPHYDYRDHPAVSYAKRRAGRLDGSHGIGQLRRMVDDMTGAERKFLLDRYDEEILITDQAIGLLVRELDVRGLGENTLVVFTADHGEEFGTRGWLGHTQSLYDELVRVPLVVRGPGVLAGHRVAQPVSIVDLHPTLLQLAGLAVPEGVPGLSLADALGGGAAPARSVFCEVDYLGAEPGEPGVPTCRKKAVIEGRHKLVRDDRSGVLELYDLENDPGEATDLAPEEPERVAAMLGDLEAHLAGLGATALAGELVEHDEDELRRLEELGYVGGE